MQDRWSMLRAGIAQLMIERAADMADAPGGGTGLLVRHYQGGALPGLSVDFLEALCGRRRRNRAQKRGSGALLPLEFSSGEKRYQREAGHDETPERIFERCWALAVLDRVVEKLRNW